MFAKYLLLSVLKNSLHKVPSGVPHFPYPLTEGVDSFSARDKARPAPG